MTANFWAIDRFTLASWAYRFAAAAAATTASMRSHGSLEGPVPTALFFLQFRCSTLNDVVIFAPQKKGRHVSILAPVLLLVGGLIEWVPMRRHCRSLNKISPWSRISQALFAYLHNTYNLCSSCRLLQEAETYKEVLRQIRQFTEGNTDVQHDCYFSCRLCRGVFDRWTA